MKQAITLKESKVKGTFSKVYNKDRYISAAPVYYHLHAEGEDYLFTPNQLEQARKRAEKNKEDLADIRGVFEKLIEKLFG
jgi:hypothetical protein